jgi:hypothetical protein
MGTTPKVGPLSLADLQQIWEGVVDQSFSQPLEAAGDGNGFEVYRQAWAQGARVSQAVDQTTQSMYILPWSGQSAEPATGPIKATVTLTLSRTGHVDQPLVLAKGTFVQEQVVDWGERGGVPVLTGRRYALTADLVFAPGQTGPLTVGAQAERPGWGYNNPFPSTIRVISQPGTGYGNSEGTVHGVNYPAGPIGAGVEWVAYLDAVDVADAFLPDHVGQYLVFEAGANVGKIARIVGWEAPDLTVVPPTGGTVRIELVQSVECFAGNFAGTFKVGEQLTLKNGGPISGYGRVLDAQVIGGRLFLTFTRTSGLAVTGVVGQLSAATATIDVVLVDVDFTPELGGSPGAGATWRVLDWAVDWGLVCTNPLSPVGGRAGMLDALGRERDIYRGSNESDDAFRKRVATIADTVSPNAVKRALNRTAPGVPWCFREVGTAYYRGIFWDHDPYDYDLTKFTTGAITSTFIDGEAVHQVVGGVITSGRVRLDPSVPVGILPQPLPAPVFKGVSGVSGPAFVPGTVVVGQQSGASFTPSAVTGGLLPANRYKLWLDFEEMRAWFFIDWPNLSTGEDGFSYDNHPTGAYDAGPLFFDFYDGEAWLAAYQRIAVWNAVEKVRAAGVGWTLQQTTGPCP